MDIRTSINTRPMSPYQWLIIAVITYLNALDGYDLVATAFAAPHLAEEFAIGSSLLGWVLSAALLGVGVGAAVFGPAGDRWGRRNVILVALLIDTVGLLLSGFAGSTAAFIAWRFVTGVGVGGVLACVTVLVSEYSNDRFRGLAMAVYASGYGVGATLCGVLASKVVESHGWHWIFFVGAALSAVALVLATALLPESVDVLASRGDAARVERIARRIGHGGAVVPAQTSAPASASGALRAIVSPVWLSTTVRIWIAFSLISFGFAFANSWTPKLLNELGLSAQQGIFGGIMIAFGGTIGSLIFGVITTRVDARVLLIAFAIGGAGALVAFIFSAGASFVAFPLGVLVGMLLNACVTGMYTVTPASYPTHLRATGVGVALAVGRVGSVCGPLLIGYLAEAGLGPRGLYIVAAGVFVLSAVALVGLGAPTAKPVVVKKPAEVLQA